MSGIVQYKKKRIPRVTFYGVRAGRPTKAYARLLDIQERNGLFSVFIAYRHRMGRLLVTRKKKWVHGIHPSNLKKEDYEDIDTGEIIPEGSITIFQGVNGNENFIIPKMLGVDGMQSSIVTNLQQGLEESTRQLISKTERFDISTTEDKMDDAWEKVFTKFGKVRRLFYTPQE